MFQNCTEIFWQKHALQRMMERGISRKAVKFAIENGMVIEKYEDDKPFPSFLVACIKQPKPLHVVISVDAKKLYVITAYYPDSNHFEDDFITRKK